MVFFKKEYGDSMNALEHSDGLAVLAFFFEVSIYLHNTVRFPTTFPPRYK